MDSKKKWLIIFSAFGMLMLILDRNTAFKGAVAGIDLCIQTLIPSLFPFFILSAFITNTLWGQTFQWIRPLSRACKIPEGADALFPVSILGGYPIGAQSIAMLYQQGQLSPRQAARLIAFCNNAGPAFIFGVLSHMFSSAAIPWLLWLIQIISAILVGLLLPTTKDYRRITPQKKTFGLTDTLLQSLKALALVCTWVFIMRITLSFMEVWFLYLLPVPLQTTISGILELSIGCIRLSAFRTEGLRFLFASGLLSFGGLCVTLQTVSVANGISMKFYFPGKLLQCGISILLGCMLQFIFPEQSRYHFGFIPIIALSIIASILFFLTHSEKNSGIRASLGV